jgi:hypothetical protein
LHAAARAGHGLARLDARQQFQGVVAFDGRNVAGAKAVCRDAGIHFGAVAVPEVGAVHHLRDRHHFQQGSDLTGRIALGELVIEFTKFRQRHAGAAAL